MQVMTYSHTLITDGPQWTFNQRGSIDASPVLDQVSNILLDFDNAVKKLACEARTPRAPLAPEFGNGSSMGRVAASRSSLSK